MIALIRWMQWKTSRAVLRFPIPAILAIVFTIGWFGFRERWFSQTSASLDDLIFFVVCGFLWSLAVALIAEKRGRPLLGAGASMAGLAVVAGLLAYREIFAFQPLLFVFALLAFLSVAAHLDFDRAQQQEAFWRFNMRLWCGAGLALFVGFALWNLLPPLLDGTDHSPALASRRSSSYSFAVSTISFCFIAPILWLASIPENLNKPVHDRPPDRAYRKDCVPACQISAGATRSVARGETEFRRG